MEKVKPEGQPQIPGRNIIKAIGAGLMVVGALVMLYNRYKLPPEPLFKSPNAVETVGTKQPSSGLYLPWGSLDFKVEKGSTQEVRVEGVSILKEEGAEAYELSVSLRAEAGKKLAVERAEITYKDSTKKIVYYPGGVEGVGAIWNHITRIPLTTEGIPNIFEGAKVKLEIKNASNPNLVLIIAK